MNGSRSEAGCGNADGCDGFRMALCRDIALLAGSRLNKPHRVRVRHSLSNAKILDRRIEIFERARRRICIANSAESLVDCERQSPVG